MSSDKQTGLAGDVHIKEDPGKYEPFEMVFVAVKQELKDESWNDDARVDVVASCTETTHIAETAVEGNMLVKEEITSEDSEVCQESTDIPTDARSPSPSSDSSTDADKSNVGLGTKTHVWTQEDMCRALDALRHHELSLSRASAKYGIPSTTLWQRAHREGIDTPKKEGYFKSWTDENMKNALEMMRTGAMSANKASKVYSIPSSTLYKIARREGIRLSAPFNAAPTAWTPDDLERALEAIRKGEISVQRASAEFGIPTGTLYGRCKRGGIELSTRGNITAWTEECMGNAMEAVRVDGMSINMASQQYSVPYSSLYGRLRRCKCESDGQQQEEETSRSPPSAAPQDTVVPDLQENVLQDASPQLDALPPSTQVLCASPT